MQIFFNREPIKENNVPDNHNLIKIQLFIILSYFDWLVKFPEMEITKVVST